MLRKVFFFLLYVFFSLFAIVYATTSVITANPKMLKPVYYPDNQAKNSVATQNYLKLLSLNVAHGRGKALNQLFLKKAEIKRNLLDIAEFIKAQGPQLVALQEADGPSFWSRSFNHVEFLAYFSSFQFSAQSLHVDGAGIKFGTAVLSQIRPSTAYSHTFSPSPPTFAKGFTVLTFKWPGQAEIMLDFISVHLDYSREYVRNEQIREMILYINSTSRPFIIMGDFNLDWSEELLKLEEFQRITGTKTYQANNRSLVTFPKLQSRLDWIFVSRGIRINSHQIIQNELSDHYALVAEVSLEITGLDHGKADWK